MDIQLQIVGAMPKNFINNLLGILMPLRERRVTENGLVFTIFSILIIIELISDIFCIIVTMIMHYVL